MAISYYLYCVILSLSKNLVLPIVRAKIARDTFDCAQYDNGQHVHYYSAE